MSLHWYTCISMNIYCYIIYYISLEIVQWVLSNTSLIVWIQPAIHEILADKAFTVAHGLISQLFRTRDVWRTTTIYYYLYTLTHDPFATTADCNNLLTEPKDYWNMRASIYLSKAIFYKNFRCLYQSVVLLHTWPN